jgi:phosphoglycolate phosphatase-like HAD superfamily hydrolase
MNTEYAELIDGLFLDFEGTLNDTAQAGLRYAEDLAAWLERRLPAHQADWGHAVTVALQAMRKFQDQARPEDAGWAGYEEHRRRELVVWLETLLATANVKLPDSFGRQDLLESIQAELTPEFVPMQGVVPAVQALHRQEFRLFVSSGANSRYVRTCLAGGGLLELFEDVYGPDTVEIPKNGPEFFARCFARSGIEADRACVVDDSPGPLVWALDLGAYAVAVGLDPAAFNGAKAATTPDAAVRLRAARNLGDLLDVLTRLKD